MEMCTTKKQASTQPEAAEKCHLVLLCLCDRILGLEETYFCGTNGCSSAAQELLYSLNPQSCEAAATNASLLTLLCGDHGAGTEQTTRLFLSPHFQVLR